MPRRCYFTGLKTTVGRTLRYRGKPKYLGGIGLKVTAISKRTFKPNLQTVDAVVNGQRKRIKVSARAIKNGLVIKPLKRKYGYTRDMKAQAAQG